MNKVINWLDSKHHEGLYELMTNQIYTAVLGSIIYLLFDWGYTIFNAHILTRDIIIRTAFLIVGIAFYLSDYYYIKGSNPYRKWHFIFDLVFMVCMLYSAKVLNVELKENLNQMPSINFGAIKCSYIIFLSFYLFWDIRELVAVFTLKPKDRDYYYEVIIWEILSLIALFFFNVEPNDKGISLLIILVISTVWFCSLSYRKAKHVSLSVWFKTNKSF